MLTNIHYNSVGLAVVMNLMRLLMLFVLQESLSFVDSVFLILLWSEISWMVYVVPSCACSGCIDHLHLLHIFTLILDAMHGILMSLPVSEVNCFVAAQITWIRWMFICYMAFEFAFIV